MRKGRTCINCDRIMPVGESLRNDRCEPCNRYWQRNRRERDSDPHEPVEAEDDGVDWDQAACLYTDPDQFFPDVGDTAWPAKVVCLTACPIMRDCREFGLSVSIPTHIGVWGGLSERERREIQSGRMSEAEVDARDAEFMSAGGQRALAGLRGGATKRRQAEERRREVA